MVTFNRSQDCVPFGQMNLIFYARMIWRELATWTSAYIVNTASVSGVKPFVSERLYRVPLDFGDFFQVIFGTQSSDRFINLLTFHVVYMQNVIDAQAAMDQAGMNSYAALLYQNADQSAAFLHELNSFWQESQWRDLLRTYIGWTLESATAFLSGNFARDILIYDRILTLTTVTGDYFSDGIFAYLTNPQRQQLV